MVSRGPVKDCTVYRIYGQSEGGTTRLERVVHDRVRNSSTTRSNAWTTTFHSAFFSHSSYTSSLMTGAIVLQWLTPK